jgi:hypothetical protein
LKKRICVVILKPKNIPVRGYMEGSGGDVITDTINGFVRKTEETHEKSV